MTPIGRVQSLATDAVLDEVGNVMETARPNVNKKYSITYL